MKIVMKHESGVAKEVKVGFSWTTFFFGFIPALCRGDIKWGVIQVIIAFVIGCFTAGAAAPIVSIVFAFIYNKIYIKELMQQGFKPIDTASETVLKNRGYIAL